MKKTLLLVLLSILTIRSHAQDSLSVLFIGNSYTYVNDLPVLTQQLAVSLGKELTVGSKTNGGYTFQNHWSDPQTYIAMHQQNWDVVVLQAQSQEPSFPIQQVATNTLPYAINLSDSVHAANPCSEVLYFMTWGRETGDPQWDSINTFDKMNQRLYYAYMDFAEQTGGMVSPVGASWKYVRDNYPAIQLYSADGSHPSAAGSYLAACTFYTALFQSPTNGATFLGGLDAQTAAILQQAADHVVLDSLDHFLLHPVGGHVLATFSTQQNDFDVTFTNTSENAINYSWNFGDGAQSTDSDPVHTYTANGAYTVTLIAYGTCSNDTMTQLITLNASGLSAVESDYFGINEYEDSFVVNTPKTIYYEIYSIDGKITASGTILTGENEVIKKVINYGFLFMTDDSGNFYKKPFMNTIK